jgi:SAM-dependent methyltransferase
MKILDATCGFRGIWYQKNHPYVTFMDKRKDVYYSNHKKGKRRIVVNPDIVSEWKNAPFPDNYFDMVVFDPPHLVWSKGSTKKESSLDKCYGYLREETWRQDLQQGIKKLFQILKPEGIFILKWCENSKRIEEVLKLCPYKPMFGSNTKSKGKTENFWILFIKEEKTQTKLNIKSA